MTIGKLIKWKNIAHFDNIYDFIDNWDMREDFIDYYDVEVYDGDDVDYEEYIDDCTEAIMELIKHYKEGHWLVFWDEQCDMTCVVELETNEDLDWRLIVK